MFTVLTNVGLFYFYKAHGKPEEFWPLLDADVVICDPRENQGYTTAFRIEVNGKRLTLRCFSLNELDSWISQIKMVAN